MSTADILRTPAGRQAYYELFDALKEKGITLTKEGAERYIQLRYEMSHRFRSAVEKQADRHAARQPSRVAYAGGAA